MTNIMNVSFPLIKLSTNRAWKNLHCHAFFFFCQTSQLATQTRSFAIEQWRNGAQGWAWPPMERKREGQRANAISVSAEAGNVTQLGGAVMVSVSWGSEGEVDTSGPCLPMLAVSGRQASRRDKGPGREEGGEVHLHGNWHLAGKPHLIGRRTAASLGIFTRLFVAGLCNNVGFLRMHT